MCRNPFCRNRFFFLTPVHFCKASSVFYISTLSGQQLLVFDGRGFERSCFHTACNSMVGRTIIANSCISGCEDTQRQQEQLLLPIVVRHFRVWGFFLNLFIQLLCCKPSLLRQVRGVLISDCMFAHSFSYYEQLQMIYYLIVQ